MQDSLEVERWSDNASMEKWQERHGDRERGVKRWLLEISDSVYIEGKQ